MNGVGESEVGKEVVVLGGDLGTVVRDLTREDPKMMKWKLQPYNPRLEWHAHRHKVVVEAQLVHRLPPTCVKVLVACFNEEEMFRLAGDCIL